MSWPYKSFTMGQKHETMFRILLELRHEDLKLQINEVNYAHN